MGDDKFQEVDLFGDPVRLPNGKRGRPAHRPTQKNRNKVMTLCAMNWTPGRIANALHCSLPTLKKYYFSELKARDIQRDRLDAWRFEKTLDAVEAGNVGAMRLLDQMIEKNDRLLAAARMADEPEREKAAEPTGKKEMERQRATSAINGEGELGDLYTPGKYAN